MKTKEVVEAQTTNILTGAKFQKYRLVCALPDKRRVYLGKHESTPEYCECQYNFSGTIYDCPETGEEKVSCRANVVSLAILTELLAKICGIAWDEVTQRHIANSIAANGEYWPVSFEGEGIASVSWSVLDTQFGLPHTGIIYTPPSFSDHTGVSMVLESSQEEMMPETDKETKRTQPRKAQR